MAALRSGEYAQAKGRLRRVLTDFNTGEERVGYCCEGVAFERYGVALGYALNIDEDGDMVASHTYGENNDQTFESFTVAPPRFWTDMGMRVTDRNAFVLKLPDGLDFCEHSSDWEEYASLNDSGLTFDQIADLIEWQFLSTEVK